MDRIPPVHDLSSLDPSRTKQAPKSQAAVYVLSCQSNVPAPPRTTHPKDQMPPISALYTPQSCQTHLSGFSSTQ